MLYGPFFCQDSFLAQKAMAGVGWSPRPGAALRNHHGAAQNAGSRGWVKLLKPQGSQIEK